MLTQIAAGEPPVMWLGETAVVVEYQAETMSGQRPTFTGFELSLTNREGRLTIWLMDPTGAVVTGSEREVRWLPQHRPLIQYLWLCSPLLAGLGSFLWRRSRVGRMAKYS
jgi:hypothetical protein